MSEGLGVEVRVNLPPVTKEKQWIRKAKRIS